MQLTINVGQQITAVISAHSATNGATWPEGTTATVTSNDPTVATVGTIDPVPAGGSPTITVPIQVVATEAGSTDFSGTATTPDGTPFSFTSSLIVNAVQPGIISATLDLAVAP